MTMKPADKLQQTLMNESRLTKIHQKIDAGVKVAIAEAIERHRKLGESISIWKDGKVVTLTADQIPPLPDRKETQSQITNNKQQTTNNQQPTTNNQQQKTY